MEWFGVSLVVLLKAGALNVELHCHPAYEECVWSIGVTLLTSVKSVFGPLASLF